MCMLNNDIQKRGNNIHTAFSQLDLEGFPPLNPIIQSQAVKVVSLRDLHLDSALCGGFLRVAGKVVIILRILLCGILSLGRGSQNLFARKWVTT
jgi:hypothetical protein